MAFSTLFGKKAAHGSKPLLTDKARRGRALANAKAGADIAGLRTVSLRVGEDATVRAATRLLRMVHELHKAGYQLLRVSPGMAPSGMYWRCTITDAANVAEDGHSVLSIDPERVIGYSSASGEAFFGWEDASGRSARELATMFIARFPVLAGRAAGRDWTYAGWLTEILGRAEQGRPADLPILFADYPLDCANIEPPSP